MASLPQAGPDQAFQEHVADGRLWLQYCDDCGEAVFMPRILCPHCSSLSLQWRPASGRGTVHTLTVLHKRSKPGEPEKQNHAIILVDLDEGPRLMSHMPGTAPEEIRIGMRVRARIEGEDGARAVVFDPEEDAR